ncbi:outer membrane beta-barrel protein [Marivirga harenae]|uniref:outer membrane beta-barrel protein n=1 Tax=Marivirga harenae TaxID=2010992 RepID=UPI0026DF8456|nr:outer membrane beta-barrel protein [Marivirga harenae]WKV10878.1 outer membrane beta-barrel protein [Marivirga harenae]|tara:strand:- start:162754 stop:163350 length:597 start_codon:yes stop_codon:yes gene_type:complete
MKKVTLILLVIIFSQQAFAQLGSGSILIGGSAQFQNIENADFQEIRLLPNAQYFLSDNLSVGGAVGFTTQRNNLGEDDYVRTNSISFSPEARYYFGLGENVHLYGAARIGFGFGGSTAINGNDRTDLNDRSSFNLGLNPGILFTPGSKVGFNFELNMISFSRNAVTPAGGNTTTVSNGINLGTNTFAPTFGLYFILGE